jgi:polyisoprenoid-binding protein YceI
MALSFLDSLHPIPSGRVPSGGLLPALIPLLGLGLLLTPPGAGVAQTGPIAVGEGCAAYEATKRVAFVRTVEVVGRSCDLTARLAWDGQDHVEVEATLPIESIDSGESRRDRYMTEVMDAERHPFLVFRAGPIPGAEAQRLLAGDTVSLEGALEVAGRVHPIRFLLSMGEGPEGPLLEGVAETRFTELGLEPPRVGLRGVIADAEDELILRATFGVTLRQEGGGPGTAVVPFSPP